MNKKNFRIKIAIEIAYAHVFIGHFYKKSAFEFYFLLIKWGWFYIPGICTSYINSILNMC